MAKGKTRGKQKPKAKPTMNGKRRRFVEEYVVDLNATKAAIRAGYSARTAGAIGHELLKEPEIQRAVEAQLQKVSERAEFTAADWLYEVGLIAKSDLGDIMDFSGDAVRMRPAREIPKHARRAISSVKVKRYVEGAGEDAREVEVVEFKLWSKDAALEKAGKYLGLLKDRHEHTGKDGAPLTLDVIRDVLREAAGQ